MTIAVLIVDNETSTCYQVSQTLKTAGYCCEAVGNTKSALALLRQHAFDVVLIDIRILTITNNLEFISYIKQYGSEIIIMSSQYDDYSYEKASYLGASDFVIKPIRDIDLLMRLRHVVAESHDTKERQAILAQLERLAVTDGMTGLFNSRHFYNQLNYETDRAIRHKHDLAILLMDVDDFKCHNDAYGHMEGDKVLIRFGQILRNCLRAHDIPFRYGGDEFIALLPETSMEGAYQVALRILPSFAAEIFHPSANTKILKTLSIGVTIFDWQEDPLEMVKRSDQAMYLAKQNGRNQIAICYPPKLQLTPRFIKHKEQA